MGQLQRNALHRVIKTRPLQIAAWWSQAATTKHEMVLVYSKSPDAAGFQLDLNRYCLYSSPEPESPLWVLSSDSVSFSSLALNLSFKTSPKLFKETAAHACLQPPTSENEKQLNINRKKKKKTCNGGAKALSLFLVVSKSNCQTQKWPHIESLMMCEWNEWIQLFIISMLWFCVSLWHPIYFSVLCQHVKTTYINTLNQ